MTKSNIVQNKPNFIEARSDATQFYPASFLFCNRLWKRVGSAYWYIFTVSYLYNTLIHGTRYSTFWLCTNIYRTNREHKERKLGSKTHGAEINWGQIIFLSSSWWLWYKGKWWAPLRFLLATLTTKLYSDWSRWIRNRLDRWLAWDDKHFLTVRNRISRLSRSALV